MIFANVITQEKSQDVNVKTLIVTSVTAKRLDEPTLRPMPRISIIVMVTKGFHGADIL